MGVILFTIFSNIKLGVAMRTIFAFLITDSNFSEASILDDNWSSGWYVVFAPSELILKA